MDTDASPPILLVQKCVSMSTFHMVFLSQYAQDWCYFLIKHFFSSHLWIFKPHGLFFFCCFFFLHWYFQKKDTLREKKKKTKTRVVIRLTVQKNNNKEANFFAIKKQRREYLESMCRLLPFCGDVFFKMLWRGLGLLAPSTGKQLIITSFCKEEKKTQ